MKNNALKKNDILFLVWLIIPVLQFVVFYIGVNLKSVLMMFQSTTDGVQYTWNGLNTIKEAFKLFFTDYEYKIIIKNTFTLYFWTQILVPLVSMFFSYSIWKKVPFYGFFSSILFLPSVISSVVFVMIARVATNSLLPELFNNPELVTLFNVYTTGFQATTVYYAFLCFGSQLILQLGAMAGVDTSVVEYGKLDGVNAWQEFRFIVFPHIWPTIIALFTLGVASLFTNQGLLISFFGAGGTVANVKTFGTQIYIIVFSKKYAEYPVITAMGTVLSVVVVVVTMVAKRFMEKYGPREE